MEQLLHVDQPLQMERFQLMQTGAARLMLSGLKDPAKVMRSVQKQGQGMQKQGRGMQKKGQGMLTTA